MKITKFIAMFFVVTGITSSMLFAGPTHGKHSGKKPVAKGKVAVTRPAAKKQQKKRAVKRKKAVAAIPVKKVKKTPTVGGVVVSPPVAKFNQTGNLIVAANGKVAKVWEGPWDVNHPAGTLYATLSGHKGNVIDAAFNSLGNLVATASSDKSGRIWNITNGNAVTYVELGGKRNPHAHSQGLASIAFDPTDTYVITGGGDGVAKVWDLDGNWIADLPNSGSVIKIVFNQAGTVVATGGMDGKVYVWDLEQGTNFPLCAFIDHADTVFTWLEFNAFDDKIITAGKDATAKTWGWDNLTKQASTDPLKVFVHGDPVPSRVSAAPTSPDSIYLVTTSKDAITKVWFVNAGTKFTECREHTNTVEMAAFSPTGYFATASFDRTVKIWNPNSSTPENSVHTLVGHTQGVDKVQFDSSGVYLVSGAYDGTSRVWHVESGTCMCVLDN